MARLFVFGIGGTGLRVIKSLTMLLAAGLEPTNFDEIIPILIDPHKDLEELKECKDLIKTYSEINNKLYQNTTNVENGFFRSKVTTLKSAASDNALSDDIEFDQRHNESFGDFINETGIRKKSPNTLNLLSLLYSDKNFSQPLSVGFKGNPHMGSMVLNSLIGGPDYNTFTSTFSRNDRIFIVSSLFGGTGAAGFPLLLKNFRQSDNAHIRDCQIGALSIMPYFKLSDPGQTSDIDSNDFMTKTKSALTYYVRPEFSNLYNSIYYIADPYKQTNPYTNDEKRQDNKAHLVELLGAFSLFHFAKNDFDRGTVHEYCVGDDKSVINFKNIGNSTKDEIGVNLTAFHLLSKLHPKIKAKSRYLSFCKSKNFNDSFFEGSFYTNEEFGLEKFFNLYSKWINDLAENERGFNPFDLKVNEDFRYLVKGYKPDSSLLDGIINKPTDISDLLNRVSISSTASGIEHLYSSNKNCYYISMCWKSTTDFINSKIKIKENGNS